MSKLCPNCSPCETLLINVSDVCANTRIYQGYDENSIKEFILNAQDFALSPLMRINDYCSLLEAKQNDTLTAEQINFICKVTPFLVWNIYEQILLQGSALSLDLGFVQMIQTNAQKVDKSTINECLQAVRYKQQSFSIIARKAIKEIYNYPTNSDVFYNTRSLFGITTKTKKNGCNRSK